MSGQILISYRREESRWSAGRLFDRLCARFEKKQIFMDIDAIALGDDFIKAIEKTVSECNVLIAIIGTNWLTSKDEQDNRRLDNPEDFVRSEIATALKRDIRVIPVLVDGALMPRPADLPDDLKPLIRRNALRITDASFDDDCRRLAAAIEQVLGKASAEEGVGEKKKPSTQEKQPSAHSNLAAVVRLALLRGFWSRKLSAQEKQLLAHSSLMAAIIRFRILMLIFVGIGFGLTGIIFLVQPPPGQDTPPAGVLMLFVAFGILMVFWGFHLWKNTHKK
jgi:hypothetical protein